LEQEESTMEKTIFEQATSLRNEAEKLGARARALSQRAEALGEKANVLAEKAGAIAGAAGQKLSDLRESVEGKELADWEKLLIPMSFLAAGTWLGATCAKWLKKWRWVLYIASMVSALYLIWRLSGIEDE
jgi:hypothetical protein